MMTIITYGGGEILEKVFQSISMLFYGQGEGLIRALMILSASLGAFWVLSKAFFQHSATGLITRFFFPVLVLAHLLLLPQTTVYIEDVTVLKSGDPTKRTQIKVDKVPFLLGKLATITSSIGYKITEAVETVMHMPDDLSYNKTGHIFGAENLLDASCYKICNADLENNFRNFVHQCAFYDLALGRYSIDELKKTSNLWQFFSDNTSKVRGIMYCPPKTGADNTKNIGKCSFCSCKEAIAKMAPFFEEEKNFYALNEVYGRLPLSYQALTGLQNDAQELISQQLVMNTMTEDLEGGNSSFAKSRAYTKQRETFYVLGSLTAKSLVTMRNVLEALIYASFIFIAPIALLPNGYKFLSTWAGLVIWIQLWPPFFSILNYIMQVVAQSKAHAIFGMSPGLSFFTSVGLRDLYSDMHAVAGYLAASIPFISYAILKGGVGSFVQLASSIMSPAHSAAASAVEEKTSGNYSYSNINFGNLQAYNASAFKRQAAPVLSTGFFAEDTGRGGVNYSSDGEIFYRQSKSELRTSIQKSDGFSSALQEAHQQAQTLVSSKMGTYAESVNQFSNASASLVEHFCKSYQAQHGATEQTGQSDQLGIQNLGSIAEKFGERFGLDRRQSLEVLTAASATVGGGINLGLVKGNADFTSKFTGVRGESDSEVLEAANDFVQTKHFQENWQGYVNQIKQWNGQSQSDEGARYHEEVQASFQELSNSQHSLQNALSEMEQYSDTISLTQSNNLAVQQSLDQSFIKWATLKEGSFEKTREILDRDEMDSEKTALIQEFVKNPQNWGEFNLRSPSDQIEQPDLQRKYDQDQVPTPKKEDFLSEKMGIRQSAINKVEFDPGGIADEVISKNIGVSNQLREGSVDFQFEKSEILNRGGEIHQNVSDEAHKNPIGKLIVGPHKSSWKEKISEKGIYSGHKKFDYSELLNRMDNLNQEN